MEEQNKVKELKKEFYKEYERVYSDYPTIVKEHIWNWIESKLSESEKWISVEERLPELDVPVLCYCEVIDIEETEYKIISMGKRFINYTKQPVFVADHGVFSSVTKILAWMPLPNPPKGE